jgi:hypothetical protein
MIVIPLHTQLGYQVVVAVHLLLETPVEKYTFDRSSRQPHETTFLGPTAGYGMPATATTINPHFSR